MHRVPQGRRVGGPEIAMIAVALAFAVPLTAWWHGLYDAAAAPQRPALCAPSPLHVTAGQDAPNAAALAPVGYLIEPDGTTSTIAVPTLGAKLTTARPMPPIDPNQTLLLVVALLGAVAAGVYSMGVYPVLRR